MKPSTAQLRVVHSPSSIEAGSDWKEAMVGGGGGTVGVDVGGGGIVGVNVEAWGGVVGVNVGGSGVPVIGTTVAVGGTGIRVGGIGDDVGPTGGAAYVGLGVGSANSPTTTTEEASEPTLPWLSTPLARTV
jgi:hypothetical protein